MNRTYLLENFPSPESNEYQYDVLDSDMRVLNINLKQISQYNFNLLNQYHRRYLKKIEGGISYGSLIGFGEYSKYSHIITKLEMNEVIKMNVQMLNTLDGIVLNTAINEQLIAMLSVQLDEDLQNITLNFTVPKQ